MSTQADRWTGSAWTPISAAQRWNGSAWVSVANGYRWSGSSWVAVWPQPISSTLYMTNTADSLLTTSNQFNPTAPSSETSAVTTVTASGTHAYIRVCAQAASVTAAAGIPVANGQYGFIYDTTLLEGHVLANGNLTVKLTALQNSGVTVTVYAQMYIYNAGTYTALTAQASATLVSGSKTTITLSATQAGAYTFQPGDKLWLEIYASTASYPSSTFTLYMNNGANYEVTLGTIT